LDFKRSEISEKKLNLLISLSRAYYEQELTQQEIADTFFISRSRISRYLHEARNLGIVNINIISFDDYDEEAANTIKKAFPHMKMVRVYNLKNANKAAIINTLGHGSSRYFQSLLDDGMRVGVGAGQHVKSTVSWLQQSKKRIEIVQIVGSTGYVMHNVDYNNLANIAGKTLKAKVYHLNAPAILGKNSPSASEFVANNSMLKEVLDFSNNCDIYLLGIGSVEPDELYVKSGILDETEMQVTKNSGAVGNICGCFYDMSGEPCNTEFEDRRIGIDLKTLNTAAESIAIAAGKDKAAAILGALRGNYINSLFTDSETARIVIEKMN